MFKTVMWATDGSDAADEAMGLAKSLVSESGGVLIVAHCEERTLPGKGGGRYPKRLLHIAPCPVLAVPTNGHSGGA